VEIISPLLNSKKLFRVFPNAPSHPRQAYTADLKNFKSFFDF